jgi:hypothetical protein
MCTVLLPRQSAPWKNPTATAQALQTIQNSGSGLDLKDGQTFSRSISTSFNALRIRNVRSQRTSAGRLPPGRWSGSGDDRRLTEEFEYFVSLPFIRRGIHMSQQTRFGPILPAMRVYHIVDDINAVLSTIWKSGKVHSFEEAIYSGLVHPFTRDRHHRSLLHVG